jgi:hypothetical protein
VSEELDQVDVEEQPEAAPEPEAPEPEPQAEYEYEPEFLTEQAAPTPAPAQQQSNQWSPEQVQAYNYYMQQQQRQQPQQHQEGTLDRLVRNPDGTISEIAGATAQQVARAMMEQTYGPMAYQMSQFVEGQARYHTRANDETIKTMYKNTFTKDETFASNKRVQKRVDDAIAGLRNQAIAQAHMGDPSGFQIFSNPTFAKGVLALAKIMEGHTPTASESAAVQHVERAAPAANKPQMELDPDTEAAISKYGPAFKERYLKALEEQSKFDDFQG